MPENVCNFDLMSSVITKLPHYTYDDYLHWEGRWELIEGIPYAMSPSPGPAQQEINGRLWAIFDAALRLSYDKCEVYLPIDWKIKEDTVVQPDLSVVCKKIEKAFLDFSPLLVTEILSKSTAYKDRREKMELYRREGVRYYLIADTQLKKIEIYELIENEYQPVAVSSNQFEFMLEGCSVPVNFDGIWD